MFEKLKIEFGKYLSPSTTILTAGSLARVIVVTAISPLELVKVNLQASDKTKWV